MFRSTNIFAKINYCLEVLIKPAVIKQHWEFTKSLNFLITKAIIIRDFIIVYLYKFPLIFIQINFEYLSFIFSNYLIFP